MEAKAEYVIGIMRHGGALKLTPFSQDCQLGENRLYSLSKTYIFHKFIPLEGSQPKDLVVTSN